MAGAQEILTQLSQRLPLLEVDPDGRIRTCADAAVRYLGSGELVGRSVEEAFPLWKHVEGLGAVRSFGGPDEAGLRRFRVDWLLPAGTGNGLALLHDVTDMVRAQQDCLSLSRLAAAGRLISGIVHEINNPLSGIIGYSQLLLLQADLDRAVRSAVQKIHDEAQRTSRIVKNLLDFSRRRKTVRGRVHLGKVISKALDLKGHDLRIRNVSVHVDVPAALPPVLGDPHQLLQVFVNLITNAEQAMYEADRGGRLEIEGRSIGERVCIRFRDSGPGIPPELRDRVFEPFFTTKGDGQGTGLGLGLCREILAQHNSTIELESNSSIGASFRLGFLLHEGAEPVTTIETRPNRPPRVRGRRIVVVEDDPVCRSLIVDAFEPFGNTVHAFDRSEPALRFLQDHVVDLIISDLHRPGMNGLEFLDHVRAFDESLAGRVVFLTGDALNEELDLRLRRHGNLHVPKPVTLMELHTAVSRVLARPLARQRTLFAADED